MPVEVITKGKKVEALERKRLIEEVKSKGLTDQEVSTQVRRMEK